MLFQHDLSDSCGTKKYQEVFVVIMHLETVPSSGCHKPSGQLFSVIGVIAVNTSVFQKFFGQSVLLRSAVSGCQMSIG